METTKLKLYPIAATVRTERPGVRAGRLGMEWSQGKEVDEIYYEVASNEAEAARKFSERTKTGSNGHTFRVGRPEQNTRLAYLLLEAFIGECGRMSLGRYYSNFDSDKNVQNFLTRTLAD